MIALALVLMLGLATPARAALWTDVLDSARAMDWQSIPYDIPAGWTQCGSTIAAPSSTAEINAAIAACGTNQYVQLGAGTFTPSTGILIERNNVILRGMGPQQTVINSGVAGCFLGSTNICISTGGNYLNGTPTITNGVSGFAPGSTSLVVADASGISIGQYVIATQLNDTTPDANGAFIVCEGVWLAGACQGGQGSTRQVLQVVQVVGKSGNTLTIAPELHYYKWSDSQSPQINYFSGGTSSFLHDIGVENLTIHDTTGTFPLYGSIQFGHTGGGWVKNVVVNECGTACIHAGESTKITVRDSYFYKSPGGGASSRYGISCSNSSDVAVINNIFQQIQASMVNNGGCAGGIFAYNTSRNQPWPFDWNNPAVYATHAAGSMLWLIEGNDANGMTLDLSHGTSCCMTAFRNYWNGRSYVGDLGEATVPNNTQVTNLMAWVSRRTNFLGNVLGDNSRHTNYESSQGPNGVEGSLAVSIYSLGYVGAGESTTGFGGYDAAAWSSLYRFGNYDYATDGTRWCGNSSNTGWATTCASVSEVPSTQSVPAAETLPASFFLSSKPSWFGSMSWPAIGPEVTGGYDSAGHATRIPSLVCYSDVMGGPADGTGSILNFDANSCYAAVPSSVSGSVSFSGGVVMQ